MKRIRKALHRIRDLWPVRAFYFDRPLVLFQSDDWGRVGVRDEQAMEQLRAAGINLGERPYDFYSLEDAEDLAAIRGVLNHHSDSNGRHPCLEMNFVVANLDFSRMAADPSFTELPFLPLADGLPGTWKRPNLITGYQLGIDEGVFCAALHGTSHFCRTAVERSMASDVERSSLLRTLWSVETSYIHWRMPWIGYEYWDPEQVEDERFLPAETQRHCIGDAVGQFARLFTTLPHSACAPGYRANSDTHGAWAQHGVQVAQNGPGTFHPPYLGRYDMLHLARTVEFEPAIDASFSVQTCLQQAENCFAAGVPAIVSVHSINFHSQLRDFRSSTLLRLNEFLTALETKYPDLLYLHDHDLYELVSHGRYKTGRGDVQINVRQKSFTKRAPSRRNA